MNNTQLPTCSGYLFIYLFPYEFVKFNFVLRKIILRVIFSSRLLAYDSGKEEMRRRSSGNVPKF